MKSAITPDGGHFARYREPRMFFFGTRIRECNVLIRGGLIFAAEPLRMRKKRWWSFPFIPLTLCFKNLF
jgi:hypothetical protein